MCRTSLVQLRSLLFYIYFFGVESFSPCPTNYRNIYSARVVMATLQLVGLRIMNKFSEAIQYFFLLSHEREISFFFCCVWVLSCYC